MIKAEGLCFSYGGKQIINNLSAEFHPGELCSIIGVNGSGKTTFIRLLSRLLCPSDGTVTVDGKATVSYTPKDYAKIVSVLPQNRPTPSISVYDLVSHGRFPYLGFSRRLSPKDNERIEASLKTTDTMRFADSDIRRLSGGERQRAYIAMLLAQDSKYLLLDEPAAHLDISHSFEVMELLKLLCARGKGIITVLHDLSLAFKYSDRILLLDNGSASVYDSPEALISSGKLTGAFGISCKCINADGRNEYIFDSIKNNNISN